MLNPQIKKVEIGIRDLREIEILPLSIGDQTELSEIITKAIQAFVESGDVGDDKAFIAGALELLKENIGKILELITEGETPEEILKNTTNKQAMEIASIVYQENYKDLIKKVTSLIQKMGLTGTMDSLLTKSLATFSDDTPSTESKISTENPGPKED